VSIIKGVSHAQTAFPICARFTRDTVNICVSAFARHLVRVSLCLFGEAEVIIPTLPSLMQPEQVFGNLSAAAA